MRSRLSAALALALALSSVASPARGGPLPVAPAPADDPPLVELAVPGETGDAVSARVESWFRGRVPVARARAPEGGPTAVPGPANHAGIRVWIVLEDPTTARVLFAVQRRPAQPPRYLVSDVPVDEGLDELGVERLGQIVYLSAMALWEGDVESSTEEVQQWLSRRSSPPRESTTASSPRSEPAPALATSRWTVRVGAEYAALASGDEGVAQSAGVHVAALRERGASGLGPRLRAAVLLPHTVTTSGVTVDLRGASFALGGAIERKIAPRVSVPAELGLALDVVRYRAGGFDDPAYRADAGGTDVRPLAYARCGVGVDVGAVALAVAAALDVDLVRAHYDIVDDGRRSAIVTPWLVRPGVSAGASW